MSDIPSDWEWGEVGEIADCSLGKMLDRHKNKGDLKPYLRNVNVRWFEFDLEDLKEMRFEPQEEDKFTAISGDVMICEGGYPGRAAIWDRDEPIHFQKAVHRVRFRELERNKWFLYYLHSLETSGQLNEYFTGTGIKHFTGRVLKKLRIPLPPLSEQRRIVSVLDAAFAGLATATAHTQKNLQNARELLETHLNQVFTKQHSGWSTSPLDDAVETIATGPFGSLLHKSDYVEDGTPLVNPINIVDEAIEPNMRKTVNEDTRKRLKNYELQTNDIVIGRRGEIGRCAVVTQKESSWLCGTGCFIIRTGEQMDPYFLCHLLRSDRYRSLLEGQAGRATMPSISNKQLAQLVIHYPSVIEQRRINDRLKGFADTTMRFSEVATRKLAALSELKQSLLHRAFRGELSGSNLNETLSAAASKTPADMVSN